MQLHMEGRMLAQKGGRTGKDAPTPTHACIRTHACACKRTRTRACLYHAWTHPREQSAESGCDRMIDGRVWGAQHQGLVRRAARPTPRTSCGSVGVALAPGPFLPFAVFQRGMRHAVSDQCTGEANVGARWLAYTGQ